MSAENAQKHSEITEDGPRRATGRAKIQNGNSRVRIQNNSVPNFYANAAS